MTRWTCSTGESCLLSACGTVEWQLPDFSCVGTVSIAGESLALKQCNSLMLAAIGSWDSSVPHTVYTLGSQFQIRNTLQNFCQIRNPQRVAVRCFMRKKNNFNNLNLFIVCLSRYISWLQGGPVAVWLAYLTFCVLSCAHKMDNYRLTAKYSLL